MKHLRLILLGAVAVLALMAPAGASAAVTTVCTSNPCGTPWVGPFGFELARTGAVPTEDTDLTINGFTIRCTTGTENAHGVGGEGSDGMGSITANPANPVLGNINSMWFFNCAEVTTGTPCTVTTNANASPWPITITNTPLAPGSDGTLTVHLNTITVNCAGLGLSCNFGPATVSASWYNAGNLARPDTTGPDAVAAQFHFAGVTLKSASSGCSDAVWHGNYAVWAGTDTTGGFNPYVL